jgi:tRNA 2-thiouridine synthesizing protein A
MGLFGKKKSAQENMADVEVTLEDGSVVAISQVVDCIGDSCPRPQLMTKAALSKAQSGDAIEVRIDNPTSVEAIPPMLAELGATHLGTQRKDRHWQVLVRLN